MKYLVFGAFVFILFLDFKTLDVPPNDLSYKRAEIQADSLTEIWDRHIADIRKEIEGREKLPVDSVFKNVKNPNFKGMPAERLLAVMKFGYSRSLSVGCGHCHNTDDWASDEKVQKQITREMSEMVQTINTQLLTGIKGLEGREQLFVNCTTCHRGETKPALNLQ